MSAKKPKKKPAARAAAKNPARQAAPAPSGGTFETTQAHTPSNEEKYDSFPYESFVYAQTQPEHLHMIAALFGLTPAKLEKARVLEIGCAGGGNLIPFAMTCPKAECVGIDLSGEQIKQANAYKRDLGLKNIDFKQMDLTKFGKGAGKFDYIICHGVYSWVPKKVRDAIFDICRNHLSDNGVAMVSYNVLPGWGAVRSLRDMMLFHTQSFKEPARQVSESRALLRFLQENAPDASGSYRQVIEREMQILNATTDSYLFHEHLELENAQFYLHEFVDAAQEHDLVYVGDCSLTSMYLGNFNKKVQDTLSQIKDVVRQEQYIDFLINRRFRHTILTLKKNASKINRNISPSAIFDFYVQALYTTKAPPQNDKIFVKAGSAESFTAHDDKTAALFKKLAVMGQKPVKLDDVVKATAKDLKMKDDAALRDIFLKNGLLLVLQNFLALHSAPVEYATAAGPKPRAYELARYQAVQPDTTRVTSYLRQAVTIDPYTRKLLTLLDGKTDLSALVRKLVAAAQNNELNVRKHGVPVTNEKELTQIMTDHTKTTLPKLAALALLEA